MRLQKNFGEGIYDAVVLVSVAKRMFWWRAREIFNNEAATLSSQAVFYGVLLAYFQSELE
jgi:hypothetical protein